MSKETHVFQTEVKQLLKLMIHALYSNKEIFLRELISNASDALDKLRFETVSNDYLSEGESDLFIQLEFDKEAKTITLRDNGIGMTRDEVIENIGTIANSGTKKFLEKMTGDQAKDSHLIGQFGVGFYSAFIVADKVTLRTRKAGAAIDQGVEWQSNGEGEFTLETIEKAKKGTEIVLHLKDEMDEFLSDYRLKNIITTYSDHINFPIQMLEEVSVAADKDSEEQDVETVTEKQWKQINKATAIWTQPKSSLTDEEYNNFYQTISHDFEKPLAVMHNKVEGTLEYTSLLYLPKKAPFDLYDRDRRYGLKLYVKRVFIMDDAEHLMPAYLRFVRGVIDSNDLPLNVSREILQSNQVVDKIRSASVKRVLDQLSKMAKADDRTEYEGFWDQFGQVLKEGLIEDFANRDKLAKLMLFASTHTGEKSQRVRLEDYVSRMKPEQEAIYYIVADKHTAALGSPHLEAFRKKGIEVLLLSDRIDEWLVAHLTEFEGKSLKSITQGDIKELAEDESSLTEDQKKQRTDLAEKVKAALGDQVADVKMTNRLTESPACIVAEEGGITPHMARLMEQMGQSMPQVKPILELNPDHALVVRLAAIDDEEQTKQWSLFLLEQAQLAEGDQLASPADFIKRVNLLLARTA
ncbi:molecular chaperone HtpG [Thiomicrospira microaerophila]|uniref:molecular chaperone HtpG n=1 Tax=Thiomicrospira microaerophila TaxID=406020 RepID=UPI00200F21D2|nr:molecular chaperone HtpG [Thiomicrospira microaerophila]UQB43494.1 molecular chaperone HtpG [Thiomicrospira microaerophila]